MKIMYVESDIDSEVNISSCSEQFGSDGVTVILEWTYVNRHVSYNVSVVPQLSVIFIESTSIQLIVPYNTLYNVGVHATLCQQVSAATFIGLNYSECYISA